MDRLSQLRVVAGGSRDSTLDTTSPPSEAFMTANEGSSKYFSLSEVDSTFDISPTKDVSLASSTPAQETNQLISNLSPIGNNSELLDYKIGKQIEAANILSGGVDIFDDNENSYDGNDLVIDDNAGNDLDEKSPELKIDDNAGTDKSDDTLVDGDVVRKDTEVVLQIDGKNVDAIDIGNGLYLYRKEGGEELAAVQIIDDGQQQPTFKFLKVRDNAEGKLEVYEEIEIEVPTYEVKNVEKNTSHVPVKDINKITENSNTIVTERKPKVSPREHSPIINRLEPEIIDLPQETKTEVNLNSKMMKYNETRKSPLLGNLYHSTPNKEGIPLTKTMVDMQLQPNRSFDNVKKTIEVHTDSCKQKLFDTSLKISAGDEKHNEAESEPVDVGNENTTEPNNIKPESKSISQPVATNDGNKNVSANHEMGQLNPENNKKNYILPSETVELDVKTKINKDKPKSTLFSEKAHEPSTVISNENESKEKISQSEKSIDKCDTSYDNSYTSVISSKGSDTEISSRNIYLAVQKCQQVGENEMRNNLKLVNYDKKNFDADSKIVESQNLTQQLLPKCEESQKDVSNINIEKKLLSSPPGNEIIDRQSKGEENMFMTKKTDDAEAIVSMLSEVTNVQGDLEESLSKKDKFNEKEELVKGKCSQIQGFKETFNQNVDSENSTNKDKMLDVGLNKVIVNPKTDLTANIVIEKSFSSVENMKIPLDANNMIIQKKGIETNDTEKPMTHLSDKINSNSKNCEKVLLNPITSNKEKDEKLTITQIKDKVIKESDTTKKLELMQKNDTSSSKKMDPIVTAKNIQSFTVVSSEVKSKPINNNNTAVPFGKWTEANRQEFLNKIKESKIPANSSNTNQITKPNDLNRRDVLKKIDSQRQTTATLKAAQDLASINKVNIKKDTTAFSSKAVTNQESLSIKSDTISSNDKLDLTKSIAKTEISVTPPACVSSATTAAPGTIAGKKESSHKMETINNQDLIDYTIEGIINKALTGKSVQDVPKQDPSKEKVNHCSTYALSQKTKHEHEKTLNAIEKKMNELHGIPFIERPVNELPKLQTKVASLKTYSKVESKTQVGKPSKIPNLLPISSKSNDIKSNEMDSDDDVIEHVPITGDLDLTKKTENLQSTSTIPSAAKSIESNTSKKDSGITENDFDKFARRNSITYENCLTVNFAGKEPHHVVQSVVEKEPVIKKYSRNENLLAEAKAKSAHRQTLRQQNFPKLQTAAKFVPIKDDSYNKNAKLKIAYQTAITTKHQIERPVPIIEDKPVKIVYMDYNSEFIQKTLTVQSKELSPVKKRPIEPDVATPSTNDSLDSDIMESLTQDKLNIESKIKSKHQRKQVLTPVAMPELELIEPSDLGLAASPKKKRKYDEHKSEKQIVPKKSYLLGRAATEEAAKQDNMTTSTVVNESPSSLFVLRKETVSALDNLVKAAEMLENQSKQMNCSSVSLSSDSQQTPPVKRGRGRPRKNPLPELNMPERSNAPSPQKRPKLIERKKPKSVDTTDDEFTSSDDERYLENWTMGKINENIVCPICNKLFRSENVVFKHVKHCTGPSPTRSDSEKRSSRRNRYSQESDTNSLTSQSDFGTELIESKKITPKKRKSKELSSKTPIVNKEIIIIEDTPVKENLIEKLSETKNHDPRKTLLKPKIPINSNNLVCDFCGKVFRQLSYLVSHKIQHQKEEAKKAESHEQKLEKNVFTCEVCKKDFRKLHHLVQHRIIHNPNVPPRQSRKSSSEQSDKSKGTRKSIDDSSAGFRCEPCDKSFRKLHHLVEHRETHDGLSKKSTTASTVGDKPLPPPQCEICKKTFRKLHHLIEHKEQHHETESEKSDDKSVKGSLSTKDIIHECRLCYMVFPNEHSLTKHTVICKRKKKQSALKQKTVEGEENKGDKEVKGDVDEVSDKGIESLTKPTEYCKITTKETAKNDNVISELPKAVPPLQLVETIDNKEESRKDVPKENETKPVKLVTDISKPQAESTSAKLEKESVEISSRLRKVEEKLEVIQDTPKKKAVAKEKHAIQPTVTKRNKTSIVPDIESVKQISESSDDEDVRYMLNPDFGVEEKFMKIRANMRSSLQIERPNSKDLVKRRTSMQHPVRYSKLLTKPVEKSIASSISKNVIKTPKVEQVPSIESDDSDVKYSFPIKNIEKPQKVVESPKENVKKLRKSSSEKRKTLSSIAKRKSVGKQIMVPKLKPSLVPVKKRVTNAEHRCDCGQLFSSAALLSRHTSLAHTPPRIRRRRSPPPDITTNIPPKATRKSIENLTNAKRLNSKNDVNTNTKQSNKTRTEKTLPKTENKSSSKKRRVLPAHAGVPVPEKMRKLYDKSKK